MSRLLESDRDALIDLAPVLRRVADLDPRTVARIRLGTASAAVFVHLPFGVLVSRAVEAPGRAELADVTVSATEAIAWLDGETSEIPPARDAQWRLGLPPVAGWRRLEVIPDDVVRGLVRAGASTLQEAAERDGVPGAQPRSEVADALLDATVLTVQDDAGRTAEVSLRVLSALTRMGFLPQGSEMAVDMVGRWVRVVGGHGTVYLEREGGLTLR